MDLAEEGCFDGEVGFEREVSNLKLKLVRKITFGTLGCRSRDSTCRGLRFVHAGNPDADAEDVEENENENENEDENEEDE